MIDAVVILYFPALMAFAAFSDLFTMTISNRVSIALLVVFAPMAWTLGFTPSAIAWHYTCGLAMLALTFAFFSFGWIGGGDAKLAAATAVWIGWDKLLEYGLVATVCGGALTLALLSIRRLPLPGVLARQPWISRLHDEKSGIPYGIALATAGLLVYPQSAVWLQSVAA